MTRRIEDYGLIGDGNTAALVGLNGSIDWLCLPRFDSDACLAALLGTEEHGRWLIEPLAPSRSKRAYQTDTLILDTEFETDSGAIRLTDFMPVEDGATPSVVRLVTGLSGDVDMHMHLNLMFDYGSVPPWIELCGDAAIARVGPDLVILRSDCSLTAREHQVHATFTLKEGETLAFVLTSGDAAREAPSAINWRSALARTQAYWKDWIGQFEEDVAWPDAVRRSLLTLKALIYRPSGAIVAAPTTSLPEAPGGDMNWDYRYAWLRDATFTLSALINAGFEAEAVAWRDWLMRAVAGEPRKMRIMYRLDGSRRLEEWIADWLPGFRWAAPVRIGNAAATQLQLDVYGELMDTMHLARCAGIEPPSSSHGFAQAVAQHVNEVWRLPDQGLWELRDNARHYVYSKVSAWVAIDRFVKLRRYRNKPDEAFERRMVELRQQMHGEICAEGYNSGLKTFVSYYGGHQLDASLLLLPIVGFLPVADERIANTIAQIEEQLCEDGFVRRWRAYGENPEGSFLACTCWLAQCQHMQGRKDEARKTFELVLSVANDLGLLAEEFNVPARHLAGNFPQALSHLAVVQAALSLSSAVIERSDELKRSDD